MFEKFIFVAIFTFRKVKNGFVCYMYYRKTRAFRLFWSVFCVCIVHSMESIEFLRKQSHSHIFGSQDVSFDFIKLL